MGSDEDETIAGDDHPHTDDDPFRVLYDALFKAHVRLIEQHKELQRQYTEDREKWRSFRDWWGEALHQKKTPDARHVTSSRKEAPPFPGTSAKSLGHKLYSSRLVGSANHPDGSPSLHDDTPCKRRSDARSSLNDSEPVLKRPRTSNECNDAAASTSTPSPSSSSKDACSPDKKVLRPATINSLYEIDPEKNGGKTYLHKDVVRRKVERKKMHAYDCECCRGWYEAVGPVAVRPYEDVRADELLPMSGQENADMKGKSRESAYETSSSRADRARQEHLQRTSRHRAYGPPPSTPPGYWDISFPDTQRVLEINKTAEKADRERKEQIAQDPRFRRRSDH